jgi:hypothetical protein
VAWTYRSGFVVVCALSAQACGGRSTTDFTIYDQGRGGTSAAQGGSQSKSGSGGVAGRAGADGSGGVGYAGAAGGYGASGGAPAAGGGYAVGGTVGYAGSFGTGGSAAVGGEPSTGAVAAACAGFCEPYAALCPDEAGRPGQCARSCIRDLRAASAYCRGFAVQALNCVSMVLYGQVSCDQAMLAAVAICGEVLGDLECDEPPPPPSCPGYGSASPGACTLNYDCGPGQNYGIQCTGSDDFSTCFCLYNGMQTGAIVTGYGFDPCSNAFSGCGF